MASFKYLTRYLKVGVIDTEDDFIDLTRNAVNRLGFGQFEYAKSLQQAELAVLYSYFDILFIEATRKYDDVWALIAGAVGECGAVVAVSRDRTGRSWPGAMQMGADRILLKQNGSSLLEPMLLHLLQGSIARRFRVVSFPD